MRGRVGKRGQETLPRTYFATPICCSAVDRKPPAVLTSRSRGSSRRQLAVAFCAADLLGSLGQEAGRGVGCAGGFHPRVVNRAVALGVAHFLRGGAEEAGSRVGQAGGRSTALSVIWPFPWRGRRFASAVDRKPAAVLAAPLASTMLPSILPFCSATPMFWRRRGKEAGRGVGQACADDGGVGDLAASRGAADVLRGCRQETCGGIGSAVDHHGGVGDLAVLLGHADVLARHGKKATELLAAPVDSTVESVISPAIAPLKARPRARTMEALRIDVHDDSAEAG